MKVWKPQVGELEKKKVTSWSIWDKEISTFEWHYDEPETCYILSGRAQVKSKDEKKCIDFQAGDFVHFPKGLTCIWNITQSIKKYYQFG